MQQPAGDNLWLSRASTLRNVRNLRGSSSVHLHARGAALQASRRRGISALKS